MSRDQKIVAEEVMLSGHSMGGFNAVYVCSLDSRPKACLPLDPWFFAFQEEMKKGEIKVKCPLISLMSSHFIKEHMPVFDNWALAVKMTEMCEKD